MGHSHRQSVLLMYLWAALFAGLVVGLSAVRIKLIWFALITLAAIVALLLATAPKLRLWANRGKRVRGRGSRTRSAEPAAAAPDLAAPARGPVPGVLPAPPADFPQATDFPRAADFPHSADASAPDGFRRPAGFEAAPPPWPPVPRTQARRVPGKGGDLWLFCCNLREHCPVKGYPPERVFGA
jgi:hypothetical protein